MCVCVSSLLLHRRTPDSPVLSTCIGGRATVVADSGMNESKKYMYIRAQT